MSTKPPSETKLENDIAEARERLSRTIDELTVRAAPKNVAARQAESAKVGFTNATRTPSGDLRTDRLVIAAAVVAGIVVLSVLRSRRKDRKQQRRMERTWERQRENRSW